MFKRIMSFCLIVLCLVCLTGCNHNFFDVANQSFNYIVLREGDEYHIHQVSSWSDGESDYVTVTTKRCGNYIWASSVNATLYKELPTKCTASKCAEWKK